MSNAIEVSDSLSNTEEQIERAAKIVGRGARRKVFDAIYYHKAKVKSVGDIVARTTGLTRLRVLQEGRHLATKGIVRQTRKGNDTAYEKIDFFHAHKEQILSLAASPAKLAKLPTKRKVKVVLPKSVAVPSARAKISRLTVDDVDSFAKIKKVKVATSLPNTMSEDQFKRGVQAIIGEPGQFKDWPGERSDLYSTRLRLNGKRRAAAFAFKGPGTTGKLVPGKMGKNGDQLLRLLQEDADVFFVQYWREIDSNVIELMRQLTAAKSALTGNRLWYGVIDGEDSHRLYLAYRSKFPGKPQA